MRLLEALLVAFVAIYIAQLFIVALVFAALLLFLCCLFHRPREALILGLAVLGLVAMTRPIGLVLFAALGLGMGLLVLVGWVRERRRPAIQRPQRLLPPS